MSFSKNNGIIRPHIFSSRDIYAFFTTQAVGADRKSLARVVNISENRIFLPLQKHTNNIHILRSESVPSVADAVLTAENKMLIGVQVADCVPILLFDRRKKVIGAVHAGWRGTAKGIFSKTLRNMHRQFQSSMDDILIAIGPSIRGCCYSVDTDVKDAVSMSVNSHVFNNRRNGKYFLDLSSVNMQQALSEGIKKENIWRSDECTFCKPEKYHSYRYSGKYSGRQGGFIMLW
jgi:YfiH family protein